MSTADADDIRAANEVEIHSWSDFLDLHVPLTVELGRTKMKAQAILEIDHNSIIQLSRSSGEGVDVLAGERRIARGEIIMIEDRTGVRVNEVIVQDNK